MPYVFLFLWIYMYLNLALSIPINQMRCSHQYNTQHLQQQKKNLNEQYLVHRGLATWSRMARPTYISGSEMAPLHKSSVLVSASVMAIRWLVRYSYRRPPSVFTDLAPPPFSDLRENNQHTQHKYIAKKISLTFDQTKNNAIQHKKTTHWVAARIPGRYTMTVLTKWIDDDTRHHW